MPTPVGSKFNRLTVIKYLSRREGYLCLCECGNYTKSKAHSLRTGKHKSCGCLPHKLKPDHIAVKNEIYKNYKQSAKRRKYELTIEKKTFQSLLTQNCYYCGSEPLTQCKMKRHEDFYYNGIDRKDNNKGYTKSNCVPCCRFCNQAKFNSTTEEFMAWMNRLKGLNNV